MPKTLITSVGDVTAPRRYHHCPACGRGVVPLDDWAGLDRTHLSPRGRQLVVLAGSDHSFDQASDRLWRMCGVRVSDQTIRRACESTGREAQQYIEHSTAAASSVREAKGQRECTLDGAKVNTTEGWREIRGVIVSKREAGKPADLRHWDDRHLPEPSANWAWAGVANAGQVGEQLSSMAKRLDWRLGEHVSAVADGAAWIWKQLREQLPEHEGVLDVYHLLEHLHEAGRALHGEGESATRWAEEQRAALFRQGARRYLLNDLLPLTKRHRHQPPGDAAAQALRRLLGYLWSHRGRMGYRDRLRRGLPIGSGQVEGMCKNTLNRRLRLNNARWQVTNVDPMAALLCLHHSRQWDAFWTQHHATAA